MIEKKVTSQPADAVTDLRQVDPIDDSEAHAFRRLFEEHHDGVYSFFANRGFSPEDCRDLTQETFLAVFTGRKRYRGEARFSTWLFGIMTNVWKRAVRDRNRDKRKAEVISLDDWVETQTTVAESKPVGTCSVEEPEARALSGERVRLLRAALEELPEQMRHCMLLRLDQGLGYREIALVLQTSTETVKSKLYQARDRLRTHLAEHFPESVSQSR